MVERSEIERFRAANSGLSQLVAAEIEAFFQSLDLSNPQAVRDALLEYVPLMTSQYGAVAATLAADWYEDLREASAATRVFRVTTADAVPPAVTAEHVRYLAGHLWTAEPQSILGPLRTSVDKYVKQPGRDTIQWNAEREGVGWARVPTGTKTCSWCLMLASRDAVYVSERAAGRRADGSKYHGACDCQAVPLHGDSGYPEGYLPDEHYEMYQAARDNAESGSMADIASSMRRLFPDFVNDGVHAH